MDFEPGVDRVDATLPVGQTIESIATQQGAHLLLDFGDGDGQMWLAWTTLADPPGSTCSLNPAGEKAPDELHAHGTPSIT